MAKVIFLWQQDQIKYINSIQNLYQYLIIPLDYEIEFSLKERKDLNIYSVKHIILETSLFKNHDKIAQNTSEYIKHYYNFISYSNVEIVESFDWWLSLILSKLYFYVELFERIFNEVGNIDETIIISPNFKNRNYNFWDQVAEYLPQLLIVTLYYNKINQIRYINNKITVKNSFIDFPVHKKSKETIKEIIKQLYFSFKNFLLIKGKSFDNNLLILDDLRNTYTIFNYLSNINFIFYYKYASQSLLKKRYFDSKEQKNKNFIGKSKNFIHSFINLKYKKHKNIMLSDILKVDINLKYKNYDINLLIRSIIYQYVKKEMKSVIIHIETIKRIIKKNKINAVLLRISSRDLYSITAIIAQKYDIPVVELQHGIVADYERGFGFNKKLGIKKFIYGHYTKNILEKNGISSHNLIITGNPKLDVFKNIQHSNNNRAKYTFVFIATTVNHGARRTFTNKHLTSYDLVEIFKIIKRITSNLSLKNNEIGIKFHPGDENLELHKKEVQNIFGSEVNILIKEDITGIINLSEIIITNYSTTALEALLLGKSVIIYNYKQSKLYYDEFKNSNALMMVYNEKELEDAIIKLLDNFEYRVLLSNNAKKFINQNYLIDGFSNVRIANEISKILN